MLKHLDQHMPIKAIAEHLGISETRVNQHIGALKDIYDADSLNTLVERWRSEQEQAATIAVDTFDLNTLFGISVEQGLNAKSKAQLVHDNASAQIPIAPESEFHAEKKAAGNLAPIRGILNGHGALRVRIAIIALTCLLFIAATILAVEAGHMAGLP